jgi:hypothetical protein
MTLLYVGHMLECRTLFFFGQVRLILVVGLLDIDFAHRLGPQVSNTLAELRPW